MSVPGEHFAEHSPNEYEVLAAVRQLTGPASTHAITLAVVTRWESQFLPRKRRPHDESGVVVLPTEEAAVLALLERLVRSGYVRGLTPGDWHALGLDLGATGDAKLWWSKAQWEATVRRLTPPHPSEEPQGW